MTTPIPTNRGHLLLPLALLAFLPLAGCDKREQVGDGYTLVTPDTLPDGHPGTSLRRNGRTVWANVYSGYFSPHPAARFFHDDTFVFVSALPSANDWSWYPQLFAVRPGRAPVVLSERLLNRRLVVASSPSACTTFVVNSLTPTDTGIHVTFADWPSDNRAPTTTRDLSWADIRTLLNEADTSAQTVHQPLGDYRILPAATTK